MQNYRLALKKELYVITFLKMADILTGSHSKHRRVTVEYTNIKIVCLDDNDKSLNYFDLAVLQAINTIFMQTEGLRRFRVLNILKLITANSKAHFSSSSKKNRTITMKLIIGSIKKLSCFRLISVGGQCLENEKLVSILITSDYLEFENEPALVEIYHRKMIPSLHMKVITFDDFSIKPNNKQNYIHQSIGVIAFKTGMLSQILEVNDQIELPISKLKVILGLNENESQIIKKYKDKKISYSLYIKQLRDLNKRFFSCYFYPYLDSLRKAQLICDYRIVGDVVTIMRN